MWQKIKHGLYKKIDFQNLDQLENFMSDLFDLIKQENYYPRLEIEGLIIQIWLSSNDQGKITDKEIRISSLIDGIANKFYESNLSNNFNQSNSLFNQKVKLYADGGSRGNPGPSSSGFVILDQNDNVIIEKGVYLGLTTNNQAEYIALKLGLEECLKNNFLKVDVFMDSLLVINQMKGIYKIKNRELWPLHNHIKKLANKFQEINFQHVPRELNKLADNAVNRALDEEINK